MKEFDPGCSIFFGSGLLDWWIEIVVFVDKCLHLWCPPMDDSLGCSEIIPLFQPHGIKSICFLKDPFLDELEKFYRDKIESFVRYQLSKFDQRIRNAIDCNDIKQEVFIILLKGKYNKEILVNEASKQNFLKKIAKQRIVHFYRLNTKKSRDFRKNSATCVDANFYDNRNSTSLEETEFFEIIMKKVSNEESTVLKLRLQGYSWIEISQSAGRSADANRMIYDRTIKKLRQLLNPNAPPQDRLIIDPVP